MTILNKISIYTILALFTLNGCGGGSSSTRANARKQPTVKVNYTLNGTERPTCHNADIIGELNPTPIEFVRCVWNCGSYQGSGTVDVELYFQKVPETEEGIWELTDEDIKEAYSGICRDI